MLTAIGMMSGTSMDGIDIAVVRSDGESQLERGPSAFFPYDLEFRGRIEAGLAAAKQMTDRRARPEGLGALERELTLRHASAASAFLSGLPEAFARVDLCGFHGQTILHRPEQGLTVQLGDGPLLARELGIDVVYDMRAADMSEGGQGAPLVPVYHAALARASGLALPVVFVNIGGISNVTFVPLQGDPLAFDTGPGNMLIDQWVSARTGKAFDEGGKIGAGGRIVESLAQQYLADPFFDRQPPKSLDRADFGILADAQTSLADGARTFAAVSARAIHMARRHFPAPPASWVICGGGRHNPNVLDELRRLAERDGAAVMAADSIGIDGDAVEAEAWAYLAIRSRRGLPLTFPTTTGCQRPATGGVLAKARWNLS